MRDYRDDEGRRQHLQVLDLASDGHELRGERDRRLGIAAVGEHTPPVEPGDRGDLRVAVRLGPRVEIAHLVEQLVPQAGVEPQPQALGP